MTDRRVRVRYVHAGELQPLPYDEPECASCRELREEVATLRMQLTKGVNVDTFGCVASSIRLQSGLYLDLADPQFDQFTFDDIAGALSRICRFGGQANRFYSVAEHLVGCAFVAMSDGQPPEAVRAVLMHDATEAFVGDVVKPLKNMLDGYAAIESRMEEAIASKYGIDFDSHRDVVREIDWAMLIAERKQLFSEDAVKWQGEDSVRVLNVTLECNDPCRAEARFRAEAYGFGVR